MAYDSDDDLLESTEAATSIEETVESVVFAAELIDKEHSDGDLTSSGDVGGGGKYHLKVNFSQAVLLSVWMFVLLTMCCISGHFCLRHAKLGAAGRFAQ